MMTRGTSMRGAFRWAAWKADTGVRTSWYGSRGPQIAYRTPSVARAELTVAGVAPGLT